MSKTNAAHTCPACGKGYGKQDYSMCPHCGGDSLGGFTPRVWKPSKAQKKVYIQKLTNTN